MSAVYENTISISEMKRFCGDEVTRPYISKPFSHGKYTYATNGHIVIRVARMDDVPEAEGAPEGFVGKAEALFDSFGRHKFRQVRKKNDLKNEIVACGECCGRGREHDCPDCQCICEECEGTGRVKARLSCQIGGVLFDAEYISLIGGLKNAEIEVSDDDGPTKFRFDGGEGVLMHLRRRYPKHVPSPIEVSP